MKKKDILFLTIFITILSISCLYLFQTSYAKYRRRTGTNVVGNIAKWNIKVNDESILNQTTLQQKITPTIDENEFVKENTLAPGSTGHFDIIIDATDVDVDFKYTITSEKKEGSTFLDLSLVKYQVDGVNQPEDTNEFSGTIKKNTGQTVITVFYQWNDNPETESMNNQEDTAYSQNESYLVNVKIHFEQVKG